MLVCNKGECRFWAQSFLDSLPIKKAGRYTPGGNCIAAIVADVLVTAGYAAVQTTEGSLSAAGEVQTMSER
jgi:hypothetical protein